MKTMPNCERRARPEIPCGVQIKLGTSFKGPSTRVENKKTVHEMLPKEMLV
jgi:hypothetical protein